MSVNVVPFLSTGTLGADYAKAAVLYGQAATISFRQNSKYATSPLPFVDRRNMRGVRAFQHYDMSKVPGAEKEYQSGDDLLGQDYALGTGTVNVDDFIVKHAIVGDKDALISHIDMAPLLGQENAREVAIELDYRILNQLAICGRQSAITDSGTGLETQAAGVRVQRGGNSATLATALTNAYPLSATGAANLQYDLVALSYAADVAQWPKDGRWLTLDAYLLQVMQFDTTGKWFSKDYQEENKILNRKVMLLPGGWRVFDFETRRSQGGLMPDGNETSYIRSASKFNHDFRPGATNGYPIAIGFCAAGEDKAPVGFGTWQGVTARTIGPDVRGNHTTLHETFCLSGIEKMKQYNACSIELTSNA